MKTRIFSFASRRFLLFFLCLLIFAACFSPLAAAEEKGRQLEKKEVVYAVIRQDGSLSHLMVVNHFNAQKAALLLDYGAYNEINRLTGDSEIRQEGETIRAEIPAGDWYYQGVLEGRKLPWDFSFRYELDGKEISPAELSGKSGHLSCSLTVTPDQQAPEVYREAYFIQAAVSLDSKKIRDLKAPAALAAVSGKSTLLNFLIYPHKEQTLEFSCKVEDFSLPAPRISALPINLDLSDLDLEERLPVDKALQEGKGDELTEAGNAVASLDAGMTELKEGSQDIQEALTKLAEASAKLQKEGLTALDDGLGQLASGSSSFQEGLKSYLDGSSQLAEGAAPLGEGFRQLAGGLGQLSREGESLKSGSAEVKNGLTAMAAALEQQLQSNGATVPDLQGMAQQIDAFASALAGVQGLFSTDFSSLKTALGNLGSIRLPSQDELDALETSLAAGESEVHQLQLEQCLTALSAYSVKFYGAERNDYLEQLNRLKNLILISVEDRAAVIGKIQGLRIALAQLKDYEPGLFSDFAASLDQLGQLQQIYAPQLAQLSSQLQSMKAGLSALQQSPTLAAAEKLRELKEGLSQLSLGMNALDGGLEQYLGAVGSMTVQLPALQEGLSSLGGGLQSLSEQNEKLNEGALALSEGISESRNGSAALKKGAAELSGGLGELAESYGAFQEGIGKMAEGTMEFSAKVGDLQEVLQGRIRDAIKDVMPQYVPESFVSEKNTKVQSVQFVILGPEVKEAPRGEESRSTAAEEENEDKSFLERLEDLFEEFK